MGILLSFIQRVTLIQKYISEVIFLSFTLPIFCLFVFVCFFSLGALCVLHNCSRDNEGPLCFSTQISTCRLAFSLVETTVRFSCEIIWLKIREGRKRTSDKCDEFFDAALLSWLLGKDFLDESFLPRFTPGVLGHYLLLVFYCYLLLLLFTGPRRVSLRTSSS